MKMYLIQQGAPVEVSRKGEVGWYSHRLKKDFKFFPEDVYCVNHLSNSRSEYIIATGNKLFPFLKVSSLEVVWNQDHVNAICSYTNWFNDPDNLATLIEQLWRNNKLSNAYNLEQIQEICYLLRKPWKWGKEFHTLQQSVEDGFEEFFLAT